MIKLADAASTTLSGLSTSGSAAGFTTTIGVTEIIGNLINALLGITGIIFLVMIIYGGVLYMFASGDDEKVKKAKKLMVNAVIGIIIIATAYAASIYIFGTLLPRVTATTP